MVFKNRYDPQTTGRSHAIVLSEDLNTAELGPSDTFNNPPLANAYGSSNNMYENENSQVNEVPIDMVEVWMHE